MYTGIKYVSLKSEELQNFYEGEGFYCNEYVILTVTDTNEKYYLKWNGSKFIEIPKNIRITGEFNTMKPRNDEQFPLLDLLKDDSIIGKVVLGPYGTGKSALSLTWALNEISRKNSKYKNIRFVRVNETAKNCPPVGFLPGTQDEKIKPFALEMEDIISDSDTFEMMIMKKQIILEYLGFSRGREWRESIIFFEEVQNADPYLLGLAISRCGTDSCLIACGDIRQADRQIYEKDSGIKKMVEKFKDNPMFGIVTLKKNERSAFSSLADLLMED